MNRREFIKSLGLVTAGGAAAVAGVAALTPPAAAAEDSVIQPIQFDKATLQRWTDGRWQLDFEAEKVFNPSGKNDLVVEIEEIKFLLKGMGKVDYSWEFKGRDYEKNYIHFLSGNGWEEMKGQETDASQT